MSTKPQGFRNARVCWIRVTRANRDHWTNRGMKERARDKHLALFAARARALPVCFRPASFFFLAKSIFSLDCVYAFFCCLTIIRWPIATGLGRNETIRDKNYIFPQYSSPIPERCYGQLLPKAFVHCVTTGRRL